MKREVQRIMLSTDPKAREIQNFLDTTVTRYFKKALLVMLILGFVFTFAFSFILDDGGFTMNLFGVTFEVDEKNLFTSPFMVSVYMLLGIELGITIFVWFVWVIASFLEVKLQTLNHAYRTEKLLELYLLDREGVDMEEYRKSITHNQGGIFKNIGG